MAEPYYDERGRPYFLTPQGKRSYVNPRAFGPTQPGGAAPKDTTGIFRKGPQWNQDEGQFETPIDWGNILNLATAGGLTAGIGTMALGGGAAPAQSLAAVESGGWGLPASAANALPAFSGEGAFIGADVAGTAASAYGPQAASAAPMAAAGATPEAAAAAGGGFPWGDVLRAAIPAGVATAGRVLGGVDEGGTNGAQVNTDAQLSALLAEALQRMKAQGPLFDATNRQALAGLPAYTRRGGN